MPRILGVFFLCLCGCATKYDPISEGLVAPLPKHAPSIPQVATGANLPAELQGAWLAHRQSSSVTVWSRLSFSDDMSVTTQLWGDSYVLGSFEEKIIDLTPRTENNHVVYEVVLQMNKVDPVTHSFINNFRIGNIRQCLVALDVESPNTSLTRHCAENLKGILPEQGQRQKFYKSSI